MIPCLTDSQWENLVTAASGLALRFCSPVYLVGSAIRSEFPNDIDIYVAVPENTYMRLFTNYNRKSYSEEDHLGNHNAMLVQQAKIYKKQKEYFEKWVTAWDFDVKFQHIEQFLKHEGEKLRLDAVYEGVW